MPLSSGRPSVWRRSSGCTASKITRPTLARAAQLHHCLLIDLFVISFSCVLLNRLFALLDYVVSCSP